MPKTAPAKVVALAFQIMWTLDAADNVTFTGWLAEGTEHESPDTLLVATRDGAKFTVNVQPLNQGALDPAPVPPKTGPLEPKERVTVIKTSSDHYGLTGTVVKTAGLSDPYILVDVDNIGLRKYLRADLARV